MSRYLVRAAPAGGDVPRMKHPSYFLRSFDGSYNIPVIVAGQLRRFESCSCRQCHELRIIAISAAIERELGR